MAVVTTRIQTVQITRKRSICDCFHNCRSPVIRKQSLCYQKFLDKREAKPHTAPYVVSIQLMTPDHGLVHYCAGTIINESWIVTAAHCVSNPLIGINSMIMAGCHDIHARHESGNIQLRQIDYYTIHELYLGGINPYDIALIHTEKPFKFDKYVQPAHLPKSNSLPNGYGRLYGWGNMSMTKREQYPHKLQMADMPILDFNLSERILNASGMQLHVTNFCTGPLTGGISICTADSGGPLMQMYRRQYPTIVGIASWDKCSSSTRGPTPIKKSYLIGTFIGIIQPLKLLLGLFSYDKQIKFMLNIQACAMSDVL
uniref:Lectizyme n=1 Tax=Glossina brevipalpis TaxID=37001 RepID=A0A1A9WRW5_9MUSC